MTVQLKKRRRIKNRDQSRDYVNGPTLHKNLVEWYATGEEKIPDLIWSAIFQIIERLGTSGNYSGYSYLDEMKGDAMVVCIDALNKKKYDITREKPNPFAYFTQISNNAFINVINKEAEQQYYKMKSLRDYTHNLDVVGQSVSVSDMDLSYVDKYEEKRKEKKRKQRRKQEEAKLTKFEVENNE